MTIYNMPNYNSNNFDIGQGKFYIGVDGKSPRTDVGAIKSMSFQLSQDVATIEQGFPLSTIWQDAVRQTGTVNIEMYENTVENLGNALGATKGTSAGMSVLYFGGSSTMKNFTGKIVHSFSNGGSQLQFKFWKMRVMDLPEVPFPPDEHRTIQASFTLLDAATVWSWDTASSGATDASGAGRYTWIEWHKSTDGETD